MSLESRGVTLVRTGLRQWRATPCTLQYILIKIIINNKSIQVSHLQKAPRDVVRDSSAVWRLLWICYSRGTSESYTYGKQRICFSNSGLAHFHVSWLSDFIFYQKPLYKSLHQSFFYSFITILPGPIWVSIWKWSCSNPITGCFPGVWKYGQFTSGHILTVILVIQKCLYLN